MNPEEIIKDGTNAMTAQTKKPRVILEPALEAEVSLLPPQKRRALARKLYRWSKQLWVSAEILERDAGPDKKPELRPLPKRKLTLN